MKNYLKRLINRLFFLRTPDEMAAENRIVPDSTSASREVEFFGGPLDGYRELIDRNALETFISIPVRQSIFDKMEGNVRVESPTKTTSIAVYELISEGDQSSYLFQTHVQPESKST